MRESVWLRPLAEDGSDASVMLPWLTDQRVLEWVYGRDEVYTPNRIRAGVECGVAARRALLADGARFRIVRS